jgi:hypothetical protein
MSKSLVYFLLFASITSAYAESVALDKPVSTNQAKGLVADASDAPEANLDNAAMQQLIMISPIRVGQNQTTAEQLAQASFEAIAADKTDKATHETIANKAESTAEHKLDNTTTSPVTAKATPENTIADPAAPKTLAENTNSVTAPATTAEKPTSVSLAASMATAPEKAALDKTLFEQINTATAAPSQTIVKPTTTAENTAPKALVADDKSNPAPQLWNTAIAAPVKPAGKPAPGFVAETVAPASDKVALDKPLLEQVYPLAASEKPVTTQTTAPKAVAEQKQVSLPSWSVTATTAAQSTEKSETGAALAKTAALATVALEKPFFGQVPVKAKLAQATVAVAPTVNAETKWNKALQQPFHVAKATSVAVVSAANTVTPTASSTEENIALAKTLHEPIHTASAASTAVLKPVAVSTTLESHAVASSVVRDDSFEKVVPAHVDLAEMSTAKVAASLTPATIALTETTIPAKLAINEQKNYNASQSTQVAEAEPAKMLKKPAPGSLAGVMETPVASQQIALDKTLLQQINTAKAAPTGVLSPVAMPVMLAENTDTAAVALENELHPSEHAKPTSGLFQLPVVPVGRLSAAEKAQVATVDASNTKPAAGSLASQATSVEQMVASHIATPQKTNVSDSYVVTVATNLQGKTSLNKVLLDSINSPEIVASNATVANFAPAMLAFAAPQGEDTSENTLLGQIASAKVEPVLGPKKPNNFSTAMIAKITGVKGVFDAKNNVYKISIPRNDLSIVVNGVKLTSAMGLTSWVAFKNNPDFTSLKGNLALTEEQVNSVMFTAIENNLNVTELHNHYLWESPKVIFMHIEGEGNTKKLAEAVSKVLAKIKESGQGNGDFPLAVIDTANTTLSPRKIEMILGAKGALTDGVYKIRIAKLAGKNGVLPVDPAKGSNTSATFAGSDDEAVMDGDIAMQAPALQKVLLALHKAGISIVAIHQRVINDNTRYVFLHYWGVGKTSELAHGLRAALDASATQS